MAKQKTPQTASLTDRVTAYAHGVADGVFPAGPHVRGACKRHLDDLENGYKRGLWFDHEAAARVIEYFKVVLTVLDLREGEVVPFLVADWQAFVIGSLFGWKKDNGNRRFRTAYVETGKGSGKSPLAAGIGLYMMTADKEKRAEIYAAATKKDQAMILFRDAVSMVNASPHLNRRLTKSGGNPVWQLSHLPTESFFKAISNDNGQSGPRPYCALVDELHEHKDRICLEMLEAGFKGREQPLLFLITNSGSDRTTVCYEQHEHGVRICKGDVIDDDFFTYIAALDEKDDPFKDETCWAKANPTLGITIKESYLRSQVAAARAMPGKQNTVLRLNFCRWTDAESAWLSKQAWDACEKDIQLSDYVGKPCWGGLDLAFSKDLVALSLVFLVEDEYHCFVEFWTPGATMHHRSDQDRVPYPQWVDEGHLNATDGKIVKLKSVGARIGEVMEDFDLQVIAYDRYRFKDLEDDFADLGIEPPMIEHPQGFRRGGKLYDAKGDPILDEHGKPEDNPLWMPGSIEEFENAIIEERFVTPINPVLRWNVASVVAREDPSGVGNKVFDKRKATGRIDGAVALAMGIGAAKAGQLNGGSSVYEERGLLVM